MDIWREQAGKWGLTRLEDGDSNVFHKALPFKGGVLTIGAEGAKLKRWTFADKKWTGETLWENSWGGKFNRLRDMEMGDVDGDGQPELVIATHDSGVIAVLEMPQKPGGKWTATELDKKPDTFVHEIEIGDIDGDGVAEFFATPSERNKADASQAGDVVMYRYNKKKKTYERSYVDNQKGTHAKEVLAVDMNGDGKSEIFSVQEAHLENKKIVKPVEIRRYKAKPDGSFEHVVVGTIQDRQCRFLIPGDFDGDGKMELVAAAYKTGIYHFTPPAAPGGKWTSTNFEKNSSGFEHAAFAADLDGDGKLELYVAADKQRELKRYDWDPEKKTFKKRLLGKLEKDVLTWNITAAEL